VVSRTLTSVGPNATLIRDDVEAAVRRLKAEVEGEIEVGGPELAGRMAGFVDLYRMYVHPVVLGDGTPYFAGARPRLRLVAVEPMVEDVVRLEYAPGVRSAIGSSGSPGR
jgi:dihydrofolate reductase